MYDIRLRDTRKKEKNRADEYIDTASRQYGFRNFRHYTKEKAKFSTLYKIKNEIFDIIQKKKKQKKPTTSTI
jgi:isopenicillin N synthase-like dioxygenase